ncbi:MAG TPA: gliding motility-associated C-terminal domain-containing protein [Fluviicola sp.]|nr:gliding motility-associated C-terminal domain-containing protein [Fluviicola sp.]
MKKIKDNPEIRESQSIFCPFPRRYGVLLLFLMTILTHGTSQNLVPNPDFEAYTECPTFCNYLPVENWFTSPAAGADYYHPCGVFYAHAPDNNIGTQNAHSGVAYVGVALVRFANQREFIQVQLTDTLVAGVTYHFSCYLSKAELASYCFDEIGALFTVDEVSGIDFPVIPYPPQVTTPAGEYLCDENNWVEFSGDFVAAGGERWLTICHFFSDVNTDYLELYDFNLEAYYYIDDVSVKVKEEIPLVIPNVFTPNADGINDVWELPATANAEVILLNRWGNEIERTSLDKPFTWTGDGYNEGVYFYKIVQKETISTGFVQLVR